MIPQTSKIRKRILGSSLSLPAHGWVEARATPFLAALFCEAKYEIRRRRKASLPVGRQGRAKIPCLPAGRLPPNPFLFAHPSEAGNSFCPKWLCTPVWNQAFIGDSDNFCGVFHGPSRSGSF